MGIFVLIQTSIFQSKPLFMGYIGDHKQSPESLPFQSKMLLQYKEVFLQAMRTAHSYLTKDLTVCKIIKSQKWRAASVFM